MAVSELLLNYLDELTKDEFDTFKWYLTNPGLDNIKPIPKAHLEDKKRTDTVNRMIQNYMEEGALKATVTILEKVYRKDLVEKLSKKLPGAMRFFDSLYIEPSSSSMYVS
uniref:Pyrin domain-containing protein n=1 Tax=Cyprinodon variegatus TaxID=28743 RepID=A0A3Q2CI40_CYPVA